MEDDGDILTGLLFGVIIGVLLCMVVFAIFPPIRDAVYVGTPPLGNPTLVDVDECQIREINTYLIEKYPENTVDCGSNVRSNIVRDCRIEHECEKSSCKKCHSDC